MSYEGFETWLCENGHAHTFNCYNTPESSTWKCHCGASVAASESFDCTNGCCTWGVNGPEYPCPYYDIEKGVSYCGISALEIAEKADVEVCPTCGCSKTVKEIRYKIPTDWHKPVPHEWEK